MSVSIKPDWENIDTVLLDMDGTILDLSFDNFFWKEFMPQMYAEKKQISLQQSQQFLKDSYASVFGQLQWYCLDYWSEQLEIDIPALKMSVKDRVAFRPHAIEFLRFLQDNNKRVILATNAHPKSLEIKLLNANFHQYFEDLSCSHEFGHPKEEQVYWQRLQEKYRFDPKRTLFVDDAVRILKAAEDFGIANLLGISQPDMTLDKIDSSPYDAVDDFLDIIDQ